MPEQTPKPGRRLTVIPPSRTLAVATRDGILVPRMDPWPSRRSSSTWRPSACCSTGWSIRNKNTRMAYYRGCCQFFAWCDRHRIGEIADIEPLHVAAYVESLQGGTGVRSGQIGPVVREVSKLQNMLNSCGPATRATVVLLISQQYRLQLAP